MNTVNSPAPIDNGPTMHRLTLPQQNAVDLLAAGHNDTETAAALGLHRVTVTRWRLYSPEFRAALAIRRAAIWSVAADRLRALLPKAIDALASALETADDKVTVALAVLKLAGPIPLMPTEPTDPAEFVRQVVEQERARDRAIFEVKLTDKLDGLPRYDKHVEQVHKRLSKLATSDEGVIPCQVVGKAE